jgi:NADPH-dependent 2,4-dienoyl-CoA reductase/sulfur reductase-like enzyme
VVPGLPSLAGVHVLRTVGDAQRIREGLLSARRVAIVGGGFIGAEIASAAVELGLDVTIIDAFATLMSRGLGARVGERMTALHRDNGVALRLQSMVTGLRGDVSVEGVLLSDGSVIEADLVIIGIGTAPNVGWLADSGLTLADGVLCDEYLNAADSVYAVGDVARWHNGHYGKTMRMEHWTSAGEQATALSATLTGTPTRCSLLPYVWSDQFGHRLQIFGQIQDGDDIELVIDTEDRFLALAHRQGQLEGAAAYNAIKDLLPYRAQLLAAAR